MRSLTACCGVLARWRVSWLRITAASFYLVILLVTSAAARSGPSPLEERDFVVANVGESMTPADIRAILGPPYSVVKTPDPLDSGAEMISWRYPGLEVSWADESSVQGIKLSDPRHETARGLRVGDTAGRMKKLYGKPSNKDQSAWDYQAPDHELHVMRVELDAGRVKWIYLGWLHD